MAPPQVVAPLQRGMLAWSQPPQAPRNEAAAGQTTAAAACGEGCRRSQDLLVTADPSILPSGRLPRSRPVAVPSSACRPPPGTGPSRTGFPHGQPDDDAEPPEPGAHDQPDRTRDPVRRRRPDP